MAQANDAGAQLARTLSSWVWGIDRVPPTTTPAPSRLLPLCPRLQVERARYVDIGLKLPMLHGVLLRLNTDTTYSVHDGPTSTCDLPLSRFRSHLYSTPCRVSRHLGRYAARLSCLLSCQFHGIARTECWSFFSPPSVAVSSPEMRYCQSYLLSVSWSLQGPSHPRQGFHDFLVSAMAITRIHLPETPWVRNSVYERQTGRLVNELQPI